MNGDTGCPARDTIQQYTSDFENKGHHVAMQAATVRGPRIPQLKLRHNVYLKYNILESPFFPCGTHIVRGEL